MFFEASENFYPATLLLVGSRFSDFEGGLEDFLAF
tara:strand:+ start:120 stop:224 length:105 start_codon:yes stop_codon:yes gene_type:complete